MNENKYNYGEGVPFQRIRRITGYLTGDVNTWNDSKRAELKDRVNHERYIERYTERTEQLSYSNKK